MITEITLKNVASYKEATSLETDKRVNLVYGLNGTGKSTLSEYLYDLNNPKYIHCKIKNSTDNDSILVYNRKFINDVFYEPEGIPGIFTLSKGNSKAKQAIDKANREIKELTRKKIF